MTAPTLFTRIIKRELPADIIYEDDICLAFKDIHPVAPIHALLIPKQEIAMLSDVQSDQTAIMGHLMLKVSHVADLLGLNNAFRVVVNNGAEAGQTVFHLHLHIIGGRDLHWPPG